MLPSGEGGEASELRQGAAATACCAAAHLLPAAQLLLQLCEKSLEGLKGRRLALYSPDEGVCAGVPVAASATTHRT